MSDIDYSQMKITVIPMNKIFSDASFNTRMKISPIDCIDLAKSVARDGLKQPIVVRPASEHAGTPPQYDYVIIAGHRRHMAFTINNATEIPCIIERGVTDFQAKKTNVIENLKRSNLNMLEEARCIQPWKEEGYSRDDIAIELGMSPGWVQIREMILDFPIEIQEECAKGTYTAVQVRDLNKLKGNKEQQILAAKKLKESKQKGESKTAEQVIKKAPKATAKRQRVPSEIKQLMDLYRTTFNRFDLTTRILAWTVGEIDNAQLYHSFYEQAKEEGLPFTMPDMELS